MPSMSRDAHLASAANLPPKGRRPYRTHAWGFRDDFREDHADWVTLPGYFLQHGYHVVGVGKTFHPDLPAAYDYPRSWSTPVLNPDKPICPNNTMTCAFDPHSAAGSRFDADGNSTRLALAALETRPRDQPFLLVVGLQGPRLPWSYPAEVALRYPPAAELPLARHLASPGADESVEWFRPTEIDLYDDVHNVTHAAPMAPVRQHQARLAYLATATYLDDQVTEKIAE